MASDKSNVINYFMFSDELNADFNNTTPKITDSPALANFLGDHVQLMCHLKPLKNRPNGYNECMHIDPSKFPDGTFEASGYDVTTGKLRRLNMVWTIPFDIVTSPIQLIFLLNYHDC
jgi:hypothetical protein